MLLEACSTSFKHCLGSSRAGTVITEAGNDERAPGNASARGHHAGSSLLLPGSNCHDSPKALDGIATPILPPAWSSGSRGVERLSFDKSSLGQPMQRYNQVYV